MFDNLLQTLFMKRVGHEPFRRPLSVRRPSAVWPPAVRRASAVVPHPSAVRHPIWMKALSRALRRVNSDTALLSMACIDWNFNFKPSWSNFLPPIASRVMSAGGRG